MSFQGLDATPDDGADLIALLPRLGAFPRPEHRLRDSIHQGDERVIRRWIDSCEPDCAIVVAREDDAHRTLLGFALIRMQPDALNQAPSAHLEALAVAEGAEGKGVGSALIASAEQMAAKTHLPRIDKLGRSLRMALWNIERGIRLEEQILAITDPEAFLELAKARWQEFEKQKQATADEEVEQDPWSTTSLAVGSNLVTVPPGPSLHSVSVRRAWPPSPRGSAASGAFP